MTRRALIIAASIAIAIATSSAVSCTRVVDLDLPDAGFGFPDAAGDGASLGDAGSLGDGGIDNPDGGTIGDAIIGDASSPDAF